MSQQQISNLVDPNIIREIGELVRALEAAQKAFIPIMEEIRKTSNELENGSKSVRAMIEAFEKYNKAMSQGQQLIEQYNSIQSQLAAARKKVDNADKEALVTLEKIKEEYRAIIAQVRQKVAADASEAQTTDNATRQKIKAREETRRYTQEIKRQIDQEKSGEQTYRSKSALLAQLRERYKDASASVRTELVPQIKELDKWLKQADADIGVHTRNVGGYANAIKSLIPGLSRFTAGFGALGLAVMVAYKAFQKFTEAVKYGVSVNKEYEQANANLASILGKTRSETQALQEQSLLLGRTTEFTSSQVVKAQTELAKLGFAENTIINITKPLLGFATALDTSLPAAAKVAGQALRAFNISSLETENVLATLTLAANRSAADFSFLERSIAIVGSSASVAGVSLADTVSILGVLSNSGLDASRAATALRNIFLYLVDDSKKLGKELKGTELTAEGISKAFTDLRKRGIDLADMFQLTDKRAVNALAVLIQNSEQIVVLRNEISELTGALDTLRNTRLDTLEGDILLLKSAWDGFWLSFRENSPFIRNVIQKLTTILNRIALARETAATKSESSPSYATDLVDQYYIDERVYQATQRLNKLQQEYQSLLGDEAAADAKFKEILVLRREIVEDQAKLAKAAGEAYRSTATYIRNAGANADNDRDRRLAEQTAQRYESINANIDQIDSLNKRVSELNKSLETEEDFGIRVDAKKQIDDVREQIKTLEAGIDKEYEGLESWFDGLRKNSGTYAPLDALGRTPNAQGTVRAFIDPLREEIRQTYGRFLTEQRALAAIEAAISENERVSNLSGEGGGLNIPSNKELNAENQRLERERKLADEEEKASLRLRLREWENFAKEMKGIADDEINGLNRRETALDSYLRTSKYVLEVQRENADALIQLNAKNRKIGLTGEVVDQNVIDPITNEPQTDIEKATLNQRLDNHEQYELKLTDLVLKGEKDRKRIYDQYTKSELKDFKDALSQRIQEVERSREEELRKLAKLYRSGSLSDTAYREETAQTNIMFDQRAIDSTTAFYEQWLAQSDIPETLRAALSKAFQDYMDKAAKSLSTSEVRYEEQTGRTYSNTRGRSIGQRLRGFFGGQSNIQRNDEGEIDVEASTNKAAEAGKSLSGFLNSKEVQIITGLYDQLSSVVSGYYDMQIQKIDDLIAKRREEFQLEQDMLSERLEALDNNYSAELLSEENYNAQKRQIQLQQKELDKKQAAEEKVLEAEKRKAQVEQAKWNKANNIVQAAMNTAVAVSNALMVQPFPLGLALAATAGAVGAAQIALISAQQIPKYAKGTDDHVGGLMVTGDGGVNEYVMTPKGEVYKTPSTPTLMSAPAHTKVFSNDAEFMAFMLASHKIHAESIARKLGVDMPEIVNNINVDAKDAEQKAILRNIDYKLANLNGNERYRIRLEQRNKQFSQW